MVLSSSRKSVPAEACKHLFGGQMGSIQDYSTTSSFVGFPDILHSLYHIYGKQHHKSKIGRIIDLNDLFADSIVNDGRALEKIPSILETFFFT